MKLPTGFAGRMLAIGLLLLPVFALVKFAVAPALRTYQSQGERLERARSQLDRVRRLSAQLPAMRAQVARLRDQDQLAPYVVDAANDALAAVQLQDRLKAIAQAHDGRVLSTRVLSPTADGAFERVIIDARLELPLEGLQDMLHEMETRTPYLFIDELSVMARPQRRGAAGVATSDTLDTRVTFYGLRRRAEPAAPAGTGGRPAG